MKKIMYLLLALIVFSACGVGVSENKNDNQKENDTIVVDSLSCDSLRQVVTLDTVTIL